MDPASGVAASDIVLVALAGAATALATGLGAIPVFFVGERAAALRPALWGGAAGVMGVAGWVGLIEPALDLGSTRDVAIGAIAGVLFLAGSRAAIGRRRASAAEPLTREGERAMLVLLVLFVHSLPEGFAVGTAWASSVEGLGLFIVLAIALQNVPEGTVTAIPLSAAGASRQRQFWAAVGTSVPQPIGAVVALVLVEQITALLPVSFAFAGAAMLALTVSDLLPEALGGGRPRQGLAGVATGAALMLVAMWTIGI